MTSVCVPAYQVPSEKWSTFKGKNLLPQGTNFCHYFEKKKRGKTRLLPLKVYPFP